MKHLQLKPVFVKTKNVRAFEVMMDGLALSEGEGRFGLVWGRAGRGKTRTCQWWHAHNPSIYLRTMKIWAKSDIEFLKDFARELGVINPPHRRGICFREIIDRLIEYPRPVFLDEIEKVTGMIIEIIRDISDITAAPFVFVGEEELYGVMERNRRVWSRTYQQLQFNPIDMADVITYATDASGLRLSPAVAGVLHKASGGDFRIVRRDMLNLVQIAGAKGTREITEDMAKIAVKTGLSGR
jgi:hypothetical protein